MYERERSILEMMTLGHEPMSEFAMKTILKRVQNENVKLTVLRAKKGDF